MSSKQYTYSAMHYEAGKGHVKLPSSNERYNRIVDLRQNGTRTNGSSSFVKSLCPEEEGVVVQDHQYHEIIPHDVVLSFN